MVNGRSGYAKTLLLIIFGLIFFFSKGQQSDSLLPFDRGMNGEAKKSARTLKRISQSDRFYTRIREKADSLYIYRQLYPLLFRGPQNSQEIRLDNLPANITFRAYRNRVIRSVRFVKLKALGSSIYDTAYNETSATVKAINQLHFQTTDAVIRRYLLFEEGDRLDAVLLADNERILRNAPIFEDARFIIDQVSADSVDVILVVKDVFPLAASLDMSSVNKFQLNIFNRNIFGFGHQLAQTIGFNADYSPSFYPGKGEYIIRNIAQTFTDLQFTWSANPIGKHIGLNITRPFISPETRYAGGVSVLHQTGWLFDNTDIDQFKYAYTHTDLWTGYSVIINRLKEISARRQQAAITARYYHINFSNKPQFSLLNAPPMVNVSRFLITLNILRSEFYQTNMLYGYGRTEDLQFGHRAELIAGWEAGELYRRFYSALKLSLAKPTKHAGLIGVDLQAGGYISNGKISDGVFLTSVQLISPLVSYGNYSIRNFGFIGYTTGVNRYLPGRIFINDGGPQNVFNKFNIPGYQRLRGRVESVIFSPYYFLGFRFTPFWFAEAAVIAPKGQRFINQTLYPAIGAGIRFRNENLAFTTFQVSFTLHFIAPGDVQNFELIFSGLPQNSFGKYVIDKPEMVEFR